MRRAAIIMMMHDGHNRRSDDKQDKLYEAHKCKLTKTDAEKWIGEMVNADGSYGQHWPMEQTTIILRQKNYNCDADEFYAVINAMWSDYCKVAQKYGVDNVDFWADMAMAFLDDKDAEAEKAGRYFKHIVKH